MNWWLFRQSKAFKPVIISLILIGILGLVFVWISQPKKWTAQELSQWIPLKSEGRFKSYSKKQMKAQTLSSEDFGVPVEILQGRAFDPRAEAGLADQYSIKTLFASGQIVEWNFQVRIEKAKAEEAVFVRRGNGRVVDQEWLDFHKVQTCKPRTQVLSSGVTTHDLDCQWTATTEPEELLGLKEAYCQVTPSSFRGRRTESEFGVYSVRRTGVFPRAVKEITILDGDLVCDGKRRGFGKEQSTLIYTNAEPSLLNPGAGSRKVLFSVRTVMDQSGHIVFQHRQELTRSIRPEPLNQALNHKNMKQVSRKRVARK